MNFRQPWVWRMAWRDSRSSRRRLLLFVSSITLGVAALVAIHSFGENLEKAVDDQAKTLLGADLAISSNQEFSPEAEELIGSVEGEQSRQISTTTMAFFPENSGTRLVQVRAVQGGFPFYGTLETDPPSASQTFRSGSYALVDRGLLLQFGVEVGDEIRIGTESLRVAGALLQIPGEPPVANFAGPRVFIPYDQMEKTELIQVGSRVEHRVFYKLPEGFDAEAWEEAQSSVLRELGLRSTTVVDRQDSLGRSLGNLYAFLNLVGFIALLLGGIGVASSIHLYLKQKIATVAVLRCLGATSQQTFSVYLAQSALLGLAGSAAGGMLGIGVQFLLPKVLADFLPVAIDVRISWTAQLVGLGLGVGIILLFALLPLLPIRLISPLLTLRSDFESIKMPRDRSRWIVYLLLVSAVTGFACWQAGWSSGLTFSLALAVVFALLTGIAKLVMTLARRFFPAAWSYVWRQGLANLFRPHNQTVVLMLALGLGAFLILTLFIVQSSLLGQVAGMGGNNRPNLVLFDIQTDQIEEVKQTVQQAGLPILQSVPVVTMRIQSVKGVPIREILRGQERRRWPYVREYRSTYRDHLIDSEELVAGKFVGRLEEGSEAVPVCLEQEIAEDLEVTVGDEIVFDVQGVPIKTQVGALRSVDWQRLQPGFFVVFPSGVLEETPQFHVLVTRAEQTETSASLQREVVSRFPNVSAIDIALILTTVDGVLDKVAFIIRFMALFSVATGLIVLVGAVLSGRFQRIQESVLLRTLGATRGQVRRILMVEYFFLGTLAAATGLVLALAAGWGLSVFVFEITYLPAILPLLGTFVVLGGLTVTIGMFNSRGVCTRPPLEVLRAEN